uniref:Uncharacterized protein n=1 Tax=Rhizophora mucronata TaxID=61149 RepID=A0A2P2Q8U7_RHIMU
MLQQSLDSVATVNFCSISKFNRCLLVHHSGQTCGALCMQMVYSSFSFNLLKYFIMRVTLIIVIFRECGTYCELLAPSHGFVLFIA